MGTKGEDCVNMATEQKSDCVNMMVLWNKELS